jgi:hypothetical protein
MRRLKRGPPKQPAAPMRELPALAREVLAMKSPMELPQARTVMPSTPLERPSAVPKKSRPAT